MENQQNTTLPALRQEIDAIDEQIISLFSQRMAVVSKVGKLKKNNKEKFFIKSSREADMLKNIIKKAEKNLPASVVVSIWRKLITTANMLEQPLSIAVYNPDSKAEYNYLVKEYYSDEVPIFNFDSVTNLIAELEKGEVSIGVFALPKNENDNFKENWWINLANNQKGLKIFARIPFLKLKNSETELVAIAIKEAEKSKADNSLLCVELKSQFSKIQLISAMKEQGIEARVLKVAKVPQVEGILFYLVEANGFFEENNESIKALVKSEIKPYIKVLGHYAA